MCPQNVSPSTSPSRAARTPGPAASRANGPGSGPTPRPPQTSQRHLPSLHETSAGGVIVKVRDRKAYIAVIMRRNRAGRLEWCLPKGHLEGSETAPQAAVREVAEETGIFGRVLRHLATIDYWFVGNEGRIHKVVHHYLLEALGGTLTVDNDPDREAEGVEWVDIDVVSTRLAYPNERRVVAVAREMLVGSA